MGLSRENVRRLEAQARARRTELVVALIIGGVAGAVLVGVLVRWLFPSAQFGTIGEWVGGLATAAVIGFSLREIGQERRARREADRKLFSAEKRRQAESVFIDLEQFERREVWQGNGAPVALRRVRLTIYNDSDLPIHNVKPELYPEPVEPIKPIPRIPRRTEQTVDVDVFDDAVKDRDEQFQLGMRFWDARGYEWWRRPHDSDLLGFYKNPYD
jgi:hypothetical protein